MKNHWNSTADPARPVCRAAQQIPAKTWPSEIVPRKNVDLYIYIYKYQSDDISNALQS